MGAKDASTATRCSPVELQDIPDASHEEVATKVGRHGDEALKILGEHLEAITEEEEKKVLRKIDWRLVPVMMLVNSVQLIDKNVGLTCL